MGNKYVVLVWMWADHHGTGKETFRNVEIYRGQSLCKALWVALWATRRHGCVKLELL